MQKGGMQGDVFKALSEAVDGLAGAPNLEVTTGGVFARGERLNSPYISHHQLTFLHTRCEHYAVVRNHRHTLIVARSYCPQPGRVYDEEETIDLGTGVVSGYPRVGEFAGGEIPTSLLDELAGRILAQFGLEIPRAGGLTWAAVLRPQLAGWHFAKPVFMAANSDNSPLVLETDDAEFEFEQGALRLLMFNHYYSRFPTWASGRPFFAHRLVDDDAPANPDDPKLDLAPVAIMHGGELKLVLRVPEGKGRMITSPNHESIELPRRQGLWLALHPFPKRKGREEGPRD